MGRPVLGTETVIRGMPRERADRLHAPATTPPATWCVAAAGALDHEQVLDLARRHFADLPAEMPAPADRRRATAAASSARRASSTRCISCSASPPSRYGDPDYYPALLLSTLLGGGMSSRLFQEVREKRGLVYSIYSFTAPYIDGGLFGIYAGTGETRGGGAGAGDAGGAAQGAARRDARPELARARAQVKASPADVAGEHRQPLRAARPPAPGVRPGDPDRRDGGEDQRGDHRRRAPRRRAHFRGAPTLAALGPAEQVPGLADIADRLAA